jgi:hypothetical protein
MSRACRPWTPEEYEIIRRYYPDGGTKACQKRLPHRTKKAIRSRAEKLKIRRSDPFDHVVPGYIAAAALAKILGDNYINIIKAAGIAGAVRWVRGRALIREKWALDYIEKRRRREANEEARKAGYLTTREVARALRISPATARRWVSGQQSWLARRFGQPRIVRGKRGFLLWHPVDVERVRIALEKERRAAREMRAIKAAAMDEGIDWRTILSRVARENRRSLLTLAGGRIVRFIEFGSSASQPQEVRNEEVQARGFPGNRRGLCSVVRAL